jgi:sortase (surface protein transpeptidase)
VFRRLPEVTEMMKNDPVDVVVETATDAYLYRVTDTRIISKEELALFESDVSSVTLVASFPSRVYSHRLLVTAELIAARQ